MNIHVGTSGFGYREWKGKFYPEKIRPQDMLRFYAERLDTVEINNTFYRMPTERLLQSWAGQVPPDFIFALKAPQVITHLKRLAHVDDEIGRLIRTLSVLDRKRGPVLFQVPRSFPADVPVLSRFLGLIPADMSCAFEFRHASWRAAEILHLLRERECCLCVTDSDENPAGGIVRTASWGYLRLRRTEYSDADLVRWRKEIRAQGWRTAFVFFKHEAEARGPETAMRFQALTG